MEKDVEKLNQKEVKVYDKSQVHASGQVFG